MVNIYVNSVISKDRRTKHVTRSNGSTVFDLLNSLGPLSFDCYVLHNGKLASSYDILQESHSYHVVPRLPGGKGGFGSMLRSIGAQIEKTTNREACRDLSGRRMRDVNNEKNLREWVAKGAEREKERERARKERRERRRAEPRHNFDDEDFYKQREQIAEASEEALQKGLRKFKAGGSSASASATVTSSTSRKRKADDKPTGGKRSAAWLGLEGLEEDDLSDSQSDSQSDSGDRPLDHLGPSASASCSSSASASCSSAASASCSSSARATSHDEQDEIMAVTRSSSDSESGDQDRDRQKAHPGGSDEDENSHSSEDQTPAGVTNGARDCPSPNIDVAVSTDDDKVKHPLLKALEACPAETNHCTQPSVVNPSDVELTAFESVSQLEDLGLENLKVILKHRGLKCGGSLQERAARLWCVRGLARDQIDPKLFAKPEKKKK